MKFIAIIIAMASECAYLILGLKALVQMHPQTSAIVSQNLLNFNTKFASKYPFPIVTFKCFTQLKRTMIYAGPELKHYSSNVI